LNLEVFDNFLMKVGSEPLPRDNGPELNSLRGAAPQIGRTPTLASSSISRRNYLSVILVGEEKDLVFPCELLVLGTAFHAQKAGCDHPCLRPPEMENSRIHARRLSNTFCTSNANLPRAAFFRPLWNWISAFLHCNISLK